MKFANKKLIGIVAGLIVIALSFVFLSSEEHIELRYFLIVIVLVLMVLPFVISYALKSSKQKEKEEKFLEFIRDLVENVKSGTPVSKGILNLRHRSYGALSENVVKLGNQIALGITLTKALENFAYDTRSGMIKRSVGLISEAERSGGEIDVILESVSKSVSQTEVLKKERKASIFNLVVQGYIIFVVFIIIVVVLQFYILPMTEGMGGSGVDGLALKIKPVSSEDFAMPLMVLLLVQAFFAGLVIGKISEGTVKDGIKHSFVLVAISLLINSAARFILT